MDGDIPNDFRSFPLVGISMRITSQEVGRVAQTDPIQLGLVVHR